MIVDIIINFFFLLALSPLLFPIFLVPMPALGWYDDYISPVISYVSDGIAIFWEPLGLSHLFVALGIVVLFNSVLVTIDLIQTAKSIFAQWF